MEHYIDGRNWPQDLEGAKAFANEAVDNFKYKEKIPAFKRDIESARSVEKLQYMIVNAIMSGEGLGVMK